MTRQTILWVEEEEEEEDHQQQGKNKDKKPGPSGSFTCRKKLKVFYKPYQLVLKLFRELRHQLKTLYLDFYNEKLQLPVNYWIE